MIRPLLFFLLILFALVFTACSPAPQTKELLDGTYQLVTQDSQIYEVQLVTAVDSVVYGHIAAQRDASELNAPLALKRQDADSLHFEFWYGEKYFSVARSDPNKGVGKIKSDREPIRFTKKSNQIDEDLRASAQLVPLPISLEAPAFVDHRADGRMYVIGWADGNILLTEERGADWSAQTIPYDTSRYRFSGMALSPDEKYLLTYGRRIDRKDADGSDIYRLHLGTPTQIDSIERLPAPINTDGADNFPFYGSDGAIYFSSWGRSGGDDGDLFQATGENGNYQVTSISRNLNTAISEAGPGMDVDQQVLLFHCYGGELTTDKLFMSVRSDAGWKEPVRLPAPININHCYQYGPRLGPDNKFLYCTSHHRAEGKLYRIPTDSIPALREALH